MEQETGLQAEACTGLLARCLSLDLEVQPDSGQIRFFAAVRGLSRQSFVHSRGDLADSLFRLDEFAENADFVVGHNIIAFDQPHLEAARSDLRLLRKPLIDTLWLNPLAFPKNPYHHLVKHYQDGRLQGGHLNDPEQDARLVLDVLQDQTNALAHIDRRTPDMTAAFHWLTTTGKDGRGFDAFFKAVRRQERPDIGRAKTCVGRLLDGAACTREVDLVLNSLERHGWPLAYARSWISVSGGNSVMPPWVRHQFPEASELVRKLRDASCGDPACSWCRIHNDAAGQLNRWYGFTAFRPEPKDKDGVPLQQKVVEAAMHGDHVLGILPTGTGKWIRYQLPALARFDKLGALTVVILPLVALMTDQVEGLRRQGISSCVAVNGLLSLPESFAGRMQRTDNARFDEMMR